MISSRSTTAAKLVQARRAARALQAWPGALPDTLAEAYAVQADAIRLWGDRVAGWKIGRIMGEAERRFGKNRFIGPMFAGTVTPIAADDSGAFPIIADGSAALEAEVVAVLGRDVTPDRAEWTPDEVLPLLAELRIAIEVAGCPVPDINDLGPLATMAAFGNNLGVILGPAISSWRDIDPDDIACQSTIDGAVVGSAVTGNLPGGLLTAVAFAFNQAAELGIALPAGALLSTGAITGVHAVKIGQRCQADFGEFGVLRCETVAALPA